MKEKYLIPVSLLISSFIFIFGFYFITKKQVNEYKEIKTQSQKEEGKIPMVNDGDHILGSKNAKLFIVSYTDLECPSCKKFYNLSKVLEEKYAKENKIAFVFRHFPLYKKVGEQNPIHPTAGVEAIATECAGKLGGEEKFWKMVEKIFKNSKSDGYFDLKKLNLFAESLGIKKDDFEKCLSSDEMKEKISSAYDQAEWAGIKGTPTIFIQSKATNESYQIAPNVRKIDQVIQNFLKAN